MNKGRRRRVFALAMSPDGRERQEEEGEYVGGRERGRAEEQQREKARTVGNPKTTFLAARHTAGTAWL